MTARDKELAMQAGFNPFDTECYEGLDVLIDLIRADERSNIRPQSSMAYQEGMEVATLAANESWMLLAKAMIAAEREACAEVCESLWRIDGQFTANEFAKEVRARS